MRRDEPNHRPNSSKAQARTKPGLKEAVLVPNTVTGKHFIAGLASGVASAAVLQPLDLLKTRVQQSGKQSLASVFRGITESGGPLLASLWKGTVPSTLRTGLGSALYFTTLDALRRRFSQLAAFRGANGIVSDGIQTHSSSLPKLSNSANLITGAVARTLAGFALMPLTVIKVRYESNLYTYRSLSGAASDILRSGGIRGFFSGFGATAVRDAPNAGLYVLLYEQMKKRLSSLAIIYQQRTGREIHPDRIGDTMAVSVNFTSGILAGVGCSFVSNPFDAVKTRIQLQPQDYRNILHAGRKMVAEEGVQSLWQGLALRMSRKALSSALAWSAYEEIIRRAA